MQIFLTGVCCLLLFFAIGLLIAVLKKLSDKGDGKLSEELRLSRMETQSFIQSTADSIRASLDSSRKEASEQQSKALADMSASMNERQAQLRQSVVDSLKVSQDNTRAMTETLDRRMTDLRESVDKSFRSLEEKNEKKLAEMKQVVDEKLQTTLEERISRSFKEVSERLEQVYKGLGEMQTLAVGVGDLKKVLSGVKTRGILGEIQLGAILREMLSSEQFEENVVTVKGTSNPVEFAVRLPGASDDGSRVLLPIDSKFPADAYVKLCDAYESGTPELVQAAQAELSSRIKSFAKDIKTKYVAPPDTTDFAIMFLPTEGLYAEVVRMGLVESLQREYRITVAGPTTMAALLNSLQMGFRTLAIQKRSSEVWKVLGEAKYQFTKFEDVLSSTQKKLEQATKDLETLVGVRTRAIQRRLREVEMLPVDESDAALLDTFTGDEE